MFNYGKSVFLAVLFVLSYGQLQAGLREYWSGMSTADKHMTVAAITALLGQGGALFISDQKRSDHVASIACFAWLYAAGAACVDYYQTAEEQRDNLSLAATSLATVGSVGLTYWCWSDSYAHLTTPAS